MNLTRTWQTVTDARKDLTATEIARELIAHARAASADSDNRAKAYAAALVDELMVRTNQHVGSVAQLLDALFRGPLLSTFIQWSIQRRTNLGTQIADPEEADKDGGAGPAPKD